ncbi:MAG TPA: DUF3224 domain-containing protein, partial [Tessaracoccus flavescens]|nr:DUF3224 domain-containing protein [Tessaracoccus flavescens]
SMTEATFEIEITPADGVLPATGRFDFAKVWSGDAQGVSKGVMLSGGNPAEGTAGYVALEVFEGLLAGRRGSVAFQQFGTMSGGTQDLRYEIVPGSGTEELADITGVLELNVDAEGVHRVQFQLN